MVADNQLERFGSLRHPSVLTYVVDNATVEADITDFPP
jgi:hypothetical protein